MASFGMLKLICLLLVFAFGTDFYVHHPELCLNRVAFSV